jgi:hypothetical protein
MRDDTVSRRIGEARKEITKRTMAGSPSRRVGDLNSRFHEWQERWDEIREAIDSIIAERGEEFSEPQDNVPPDGIRVSQPDNVAGGSTGFIVKEYKGLEADVTVYKVDRDLIGLYRLLLDYGRRAAQELGQWKHKRPVALEELEEDDEMFDVSLLTIEEREAWSRLTRKAMAKPKTAQ